MGKLRRYLPLLPDDFEVVVRDASTKQTVPILKNTRERGICGEVFNNIDVFPKSSNGDAVKNKLAFW